MADFFKKNQYCEKKIVSFSESADTQLSYKTISTRQRKDKVPSHYAGLPVKFFSFASVGLLGVVVHLFFLTLLHQWLMISFIESQAAATFIAMTNNYFLNNITTFKNQRRSGKQHFAGLLSFYLACSVGALINLACANLLYQYHFNWAIAGLIACFSGALWNFCAAVMFTWRRTIK